VNIIHQLDKNLTSGEDDSEQIGEAFAEFYHLFDELGIIDKRGFQNINKWSKNKAQTKY
jgi:hypothetical protein